MNKPTLSEYKITDYQYSKYLEYKSKCDSKEGKKTNFEDNLFWFYALIIYLSFEIFLFSRSWEKLNDLSLGRENWEFTKTVLLIVFLPLLAFPLNILAVSISSIILNIIGFGKLITYLYSILLKQPKREYYFFNIEIFEKREKEYIDYIKKLEEEYPGIANFNYDKKMYFKKIMNDIIEHEKKYINEIIHQRNIKKQSEYWLSLDGFSFEQEVSDLYRSLGYKVKTTKKVADGGIDIKLWDDKGEYIIVQCKNHKHKIAPSIIRDLYGTMHKEKADRAILICSGGFNDSVYDFAKGLPIDLLELEDIISLSDKAHPKSYEIIDTIKEMYCIDEMIFKFKSMGSVYLLYNLFRNAAYNEKETRVELIELINSMESAYCVFESKEKSKTIVDIILKQKYKPLENAIYEIVEWKIYPNDSPYRYKAFYYVKIIKEGEDYFMSNKKNDSYENVKVSGFPKRKKRKKWYGWNRYR
jgi:restriction system protein